MTEKILGQEFVMQSKTFEHPLEQLFNIEAGTTVNPMIPQKVVDTETGEIVAHAKHEEDEIIDHRLEQVFDAAMSAYEEQTEFVQSSDPKFAARNAEVAAGFLKIALDTVNSKIVAQDKRIGRRGKQQGPVTNNNTLNVIADRNELLRMLASHSDDSK